MTINKAIEVAKALRDELKPIGMPDIDCTAQYEKVDALTTLITLAESADAATDEEALKAIEVMQWCADCWENTADATNESGGSVESIAEYKCRASAIRAGAAAITALAASEARVKTLTGALRSMSDAAEMLWIVLANVSGGDWEKQSPEWQGAAARWRDNYFAALKEHGHE